MWQFFLGEIEVAKAEHVMQGVAAEKRPHLLSEKAEEDYVRNILRTNETFISKFVAWFNNIFGDGNGDFLTVLRAVDSFLENTAQKFLQAFGAYNSIRRHIVVQLHEMVIPPIYDPMFAIFTRKFRQNDEGILEMCTALQNEHPHFFHKDDSYLTRLTPEALLPAVYRLRRVAACRDPSQKLMHLVSTQRALSAAVGADFIGADLLVPLLVYVMVTAQVPHLHSEMEFTYHFLAPRDTYAHTALSHSSSVLKDRERDEEYVLVTFYSLVTNALPILRSFQKEAASAVVKSLLG